MNDKEVQYWSDFYSKFNIKQCSPFCRFVINHFKSLPNTTNLIDIGCGNGRDSYELAKHFNVVGIDQSNLPDTDKNPRFEKADFTTYDFKGFHIIYSRFTFHSIPNQLHHTLLQNILKNQILCIETRSDKGTTTETHYGDTHYRNLTNIKYITELLTHYNFLIHYIKEDKGFAPFKDEDPVCIRIIATKT